jgi:hypothetical protein
LVFGPPTTLQNVAVISWRQITSVVTWLLENWPPVVVPVLVPSALAVLAVANWLFVVAFCPVVGMVWAWAPGDAVSRNAEASTAIKAVGRKGSVFIGAPVSRADWRYRLPRGVNVPHPGLVRNPIRAAPASIFHAKILRQCSMAPMRAGIVET